MKAIFTPFDSRQTMIAADCEVFHYREPYGKTLDFHSHDFYELYVFVDGNVTYYIEEKMYILIGGDIMLIPPGRMHRPVITDPGSVYERIVIWINPSYLEKLDEDRSISQGLQSFESTGTHLIRLPQSDFDQIHEILKLLLKEDTMNLSGKPLMKKSLLSMLLVSFIRQTINRTECHAHTEPDGIVPDVIRYINDHLNESISLEILADLFFVSKYHLLKEFKRYTCSTVCDYIISKRIIAAKEMIHRGHTVTESCRLCGFSDYSNFYKSFVKKCGVTPKQFKLLSKEKE